MSTKSPTPRELFAELLANCPREEWETRLAEIRQHDAALAERVEKLLRAHLEPQSFLDRPLSPTTIQPADESAIGQQIGPYKLREQIGEGGFGVVYVAEQTRPIRRKVALKIIKPGMDSKEIIARFEAERQALALMDHPNIAKVLDAATTETGRPYFVMELVRGLPITEFCDREKLPTDDRLRLFTDVCRAVQHAHQKGVIHRDLKPSNVLVTLHDGKPVPKVIDFGVAKALSQQLTEHTLYTAMGQMVGTPMYMSPEQAEMSGLDVDTRSDVYSLGVLLYELLTGSTPFDKQTLKEAGLDGMRRIIRETEPVKPSARISTLKNDHGETISDKRSVDSRKLEQALRGDLDWVVMKALEKDRNRRYATPSDLANDVQRHLAQQPVEAGPPSLLYRTRKYVARHKVLLTTVALVLIAMIAGTGFSVSYAIQANQARADAETAEQLANERLELLQSDRAKLEEQQAQLLASDQEMADMCERLAYTYFMDSGDYSRAATVFRQTVNLRDRLCRMFPNDLNRRRDAIHPRNGLGWSLINLDRHADAETVFQEAVAIIDEVSRRNAQVVLSPGGPRWIFQCYEGLTDCLFEAGERVEGMESFRRGLLVIDREFEKQDRAAFAKDYEYCARHLAINEELRDARRSLQYAKRAVELDIDQSTNWKTLGIALYYNDQFSQAVESLSISEQLDESGDDAHWNALYLAMSYWQLGETILARERLRTLSEYSESEGVTDSFRSLHDEALHLIRFDDSVVEPGPDTHSLHASQASASLRNAPDDWTLVEQLRLRLAQFLVERTDWGRIPDDVWTAIVREDEFFTELTRLMPDDYRPWEARAQAYAIAEEWDQAAADYVEALRLIDDTEHSVWWHPGAKLATRIAQSPELFQRVRTLRPNDDRLSVARVREYAANGEFEFAADELAGVVERNPGDFWAKYVQAQLQLATDDTEGYRQTCDELLALTNNSTNNTVRIRTSRACLLTQDLTQDRLDEVEAIVRATKPPAGWERLFDIAAGLLAYRQGDFAAARDQFPLTPHPLAERQAITDIILALVEFRDGHQERARELYDAAVAAMETERLTGDQTHRRMEIDQWLTYEILRREAADLLGVDDDASVESQSDTLTSNQEESP